MEYIDTHCHMDSILAKLELPDFSAFRARFLAPDFGGCITISCDPDSIEAALALSGENKVYAAFGIHPHDAKAYTPELEESLRSAMAGPKSVAWGEIGLDYHYNFSPP